MTKIQQMTLQQIQLNAEQDFMESDSEPESDYSDSDSEPELESDYGDSEEDIEEKIKQHYLRQVSIIIKDKLPIELQNVIYEMAGPCEKQVQLKKQMLKQLKESFYDHMYHVPMWPYDEYLDEPVEYYKDTCFKFNYVNGVIRDDDTPLLLTRFFLRRKHEKWDLQNKMYVIGEIAYHGHTERLETVNPITPSKVLENSIRCHWSFHDFLWYE